jgi:hypothetical protein
MKPARIGLLALIAVSAALVAYLAVRNPQPPQLPVDEAHASRLGATPCLDCHGPAGPAPRSRSHPLGQDCLRCHGTR